MREKETQLDRNMAMASAHTSMVLLIMVDGLKTERKGMVDTKAKIRSTITMESGEMT